jgi:hypothetical protein
VTPASRCALAAAVGLALLGPGRARADEPAPPDPGADGDPGAGPASTDPAPAEPAPAEAALASPVAPTAAPPAASPTRLALAVELFGRYGYVTAGGTSTSAFELDRAELGASVELGGGVTGELRLESLRAADEQSLLALSGDPLVIGVKRAWGGYARAVGGEVRIGGRLGLIADPWIASIESAYDLRALGPTAAEDAGLVESSDLGAAITATWADRVTAEVAVTNGEGRRQIEQNNGKTTTAVVTARLATFALVGDEESVRVHVGGRDGSTGAAEVRGHRLLGGVTLDGARLGAGLEAARGYGVGDRGDVVATTVGGWLRAQLVPRRLGVIARFARLDPDGAIASDARTSLAGGVFTDLPVGASRARRARVYALAWAVRYGPAAPPLPSAAAAANATGVSIVLDLAGALTP